MDSVSGSCSRDNGLKAVILTEVLCVLLGPLYTNDAVNLISNRRFPTHSNILCYTVAAANSDVKIYK